MADENEQELERFVQRRCLVCDVPRPGARAKGVEHCPRCDRDTPTRSIARPEEPIAPGAAITFGQQEALYLGSRCGS